MKNFNKIEAYISGEMSLIEKSAFEKQLAADKELAAEFKLQQIEEEAIAWQADQLLKNKIKKIGAENQLFKSAEKTPLKIRWKKILTAAATVTLLVAAYFIFQNNNTSPEAIALQHYIKTPPSVTVTRSPDKEIDSFFKSVQKIMTDEDDKLDGSILFLKNIPSDSPDFVDANYWLGHAYFKQKKYAESIAYFSKIREITDRPELTDASDYYLIIAHLTEHGNDDEFYKLVTTLYENKAHPYLFKIKNLHANVGSPME